MRVIGQLFELYLICEVNGDHFIIDQHAAHERIRYETLKEHIKNSSPKIQKLLSPIVIENISEREKDVLRRNLRNINKLGFYSAFTGENSFTIWSVPTFSYRHLMPSVINNIKEILLDIQYWAITKERIIQLIACHSSIRGRTRLNRLGMYKLISELSKLHNPWVCPHGRPIIKKIYLTGTIKYDSMLKKELDKEFQRI
jgi:DNA mismatch repair protein MutL